MDSASLATALSALVAEPSRVIDTPQVVDRLSRDFYWYSPVLKKLLDGKRGDVVVQPVNDEEVRRVLAYCYEHEIPVTARGSGPATTDRLCRFMAESFSILAHGSDRRDSAPTASPNASPVCGSRRSRPRRASRDGSCAAIHQPWLRHRSEDFSAEAQAASARLPMAACGTFNTVRAIEVVTMEAQPRLLKYEGKSPRHSACMGHQRHHHAHLARACTGC